MPRLLASRLCLAFLLTLAGLRPGLAQESEARLKAAFVYRFLQFVDWPGGSGDSGGKLQVCVAGRDDLAGAWADIEGKVVRGRRLEMREISAPGQLERCHAVYLGSGVSLPDWLEPARQARVLTLSDQAGFAARGGMIELLRRDNRLRFEINLAASRAAGLYVSSNLLKLATQVHE